ncbi:glycosyltransferase family 4 protein [Edaphovirga cremea]|uniref:glycosyltransferase family 4 protein n=1 Tax=Edaphovirga cremea TaxID=2267246 RepID=UPI003989E144
MNVLLLNQCFYPDVMATAQQLTDLALGLSEAGHTVTVIASDRGYDDPSQRFPPRETWRGINIIRIPSLALGKKSRLRRSINFGTFLINCSWQLLRLKRFDVVVALTSPPLISYLGSLFVRLRGGKFFFWVMDLNPDEAIAAGWLKENSLPAKLFAALLKSSLAHADGIIALDHFMKSRIVAKGVPSELVTVLPPWAHDDRVNFDHEGREVFRREHGLKDVFVVMYAGNHSPCHPLHTLMEAARELSTRKDIVFLFVGGGSEQEKVRQFAAQHELETVRCLPYQSAANLSASLSAADLHTVVMGEEFVGIVHPCKLYNILRVGCPFLYIGPTESHVGEIAAQLDSSRPAYLATHGNASLVVQHILKALADWREGKPRPVAEIASSFSRQALLPRMISLLESEKPEEAPLTKPVADGRILAGRSS